MIGKPNLAIRRRRRQQQFEHSRRILSSSSSQSLPLCSCVSICCFFITYSLLSSALLFWSSDILFFFLFFPAFSVLVMKTEDDAGFSFRIWVWVFALCVACVFLVFLPCFCLRSLSLFFPLGLCSALPFIRPESLPLNQSCLCWTVIPPRTGLWAEDVVMIGSALLPIFQLPC